MKSEQFLITSTKGHNVIKYKWNSARKEVGRLMQEYAQQQRQLEAMERLVAHTEAADKLKLLNSQEQ